MKQCHYNWRQTAFWSPPGNFLSPFTHGESYGDQSWACHVHLQIGFEWKQGKYWCAHGRRWQCCPQTCGMEWWETWAVLSSNHLYQPLPLIFRRCLILICADIHLSPNALRQVAIAILNKNVIETKTKHLYQRHKERQTILISHKWVCNCLFSFKAVKRKGWNIITIELSSSKRKEHDFLKGTKLCLACFNQSKTEKTQTLTWALSKECRIIACFFSIIFLKIIKWNISYD